MKRLLLGSLGTLLVATAAAPAFANEVAAIALRAYMIDSY